MKKTLTFIFLATFVLSGVFAQNWQANLPEDKSKSELTFFDYQNAFNSYWDQYDVKNGYYTENGVRKKARGWKQFKRWEYQTRFEINTQTGEMPQKTAAQVYKEFVRTNPQNKHSRSANWVSLGTNSSTGGYAGIGRINCVAFHPTDNNTYWVGAPAGGIWKTTNNGNSWTCLSNENDVQGVSSIIIPTDYATSNTIYIGTGDRDSWDNGSVGVLKSTNGGSTWNSTGLSYNLSESAMIYKMIIDPSNNNTILAATSNGVYKTTNGGTTWTNQLTATTFKDLEAKPGNFSTLYGSTGNGKIFVSTDAGSNWSENFNTGSRVEIAVNPDDASLVYAVVSGSDSGLEGVYKSTNSGTSFSQVLSGTTTNLLGWDSDGSDEGGQGWYDLSIAASPNDADVVIVGGVNTWRSTNGGSSWTNIAHWAGGTQTVHADKHNHDFRSNGDLFECNDGGIYFSTDNGTTLTDKTNGITISQMYKLSVSQTVDDETITGLQDNGSKLRRSGGTWEDVKGGDGMECLIDYTDVDIQYASSQRGNISRTTDRWNNTYEDVTPSGAGEGAWVTPYMIDPNNHNTLYAGYSEVWKSTNNGTSWSAISSFNTSLQLLGIAPSNSQVILAASYSNLWRTTNGGGSWTDITGTLAGLSGSVTYITVKDDDPNTIWVTISGFNSDGVYESTNGGTTWTNISAGLPQIPVRTIVQNKQSLNEVHLYAGTQLGVFFKKGSDNWVEFNSGMPKVRAGELEIYYNSNPASSKLRLATFGRGLWESPLEQTVAGLALLSTNSPSSVTSSSAVCGGNISDIGASSITERGIVWSASPNPTTSDNKIDHGTTGTGSYSSTISNLSAATTYYVRAYAINSQGIAYGNDQQFSTGCGNVTNFPYSEGFEGGSFPPNCWTTYRGTNGEGTAEDWKLSSTASTGSNAGYVKYQAVDNMAQDWLVSPAFVIPAGAEVSLSYFERQEYAQDYSTSYSIKISTSSQTDISSFTNFATYGESTFDLTYSENIHNLSTYEGQTIYIAFVMEQNDGDSWFVDDIKLEVTVPEIEYCEAGATSGSELINDFSFGTITNNGSALGTDGYQDWTTLSTNIVRNTSYGANITLSSGFAQDQCRIWIDWNQNGDFGDSDELVYESGIGSGPFSGNITVPNTAKIGDTRMRVRVWDTSDQLIAGAPCGNEKWGEVEDYTVTVHAPASSTALAEMGINIFPNPSSGEFNILMNRAITDASYEISDLTGKLILKDNIQNSNTHVKLNTPAGFYFIKFNVEGNTTVSTLIIE